MELKTEGGGQKVKPSYFATDENNKIGVMFHRNQIALLKEWRN